MLFERLDNVWVISDTHFGHDNIIKYCGRPPKSEKMMIERWEEAIRSRNDIVLHLGDLMFADKLPIGPDGERMLRRIRGLPGQKYLIKGNHDKGTPEKFKEHRFTMVDPFSIVVGQDYERGPLRLLDSDEPLDGKPGWWEVSFSHYPADGELENFQWRVHGHIHNHGYDPDLFTPYRRNHLNVSVEMTAYRPVNLKVLLESALLGQCKRNTERPWPR